MLIVYLSLSGNIRRFVKAVGMDSVELSYSNPLASINEDYILIMPSYDDEITDIISEFIEYENNLKHLVAIVGSGNTNFGDDGYCFNAVEVSRKYNKPLLFKFEHSGENDITNFKKEVDKFGISKTN